MGPRASAWIGGFFGPPRGWVVRGFSRSLSMPNETVAQQKAPARAVRSAGRVGLARAASRVHGPYVAGVVALAAVYYAAAKLGYVLEFAGPVAAIVWLPAGAAIAFLALGGLRFWPGALLGDLFANDYAALPLGSALGQTLGNMLEVLVAAVLIRRLIARGSPLESLSGLGQLLVVIAGATAISATVGPLSLLAGDVISGGELSEVARTWWLGDATGALVVIPFALAWYQPPVRQWARRRGMEALVMLAAVAATSEIAFRTERPVAYLVFPALGWAALRFGRRGATLAIVVAVGFAVWNTTHYHGPFVFDSITLSVLNAQLYIAVAAVSTLCLTALVRERRRFADGSTHRARGSSRSPTPSDDDSNRTCTTAPSSAPPRSPFGSGWPPSARDAHEPGAPPLESAETEGVLAI